jgi:hypothetical protein
MRSRPTRHEATVLLLLLAAIILAGVFAVVGEAQHGSAGPSAPGRTAGGGR